MELAHSRGRTQVENFLDQLASPVKSGLPEPCRKSGSSKSQQPISPEVVNAAFRAVAQDQVDTLRKMIAAGKISPNDFATLKNKGGSTLLSMAKTRRKAKVLEYMESLVDQDSSLLEDLSVHRGVSYASGSFGGSFGELLGLCSRIFLEL